MASNLCNKYKPKSVTNKVTAQFRGQAVQGEGVRKGWWEKSNNSKVTTYG